MEAAPKPERSRMDRAERIYPNDRKTILVLFGLLEARVVKSLHLRPAAIRELGDLEFPDKEHAVLTAFAGGARRPAS